MRHVSADILLRLLFALAGSYAVSGIVVRSICHAQSEYVRDSGTVFANDEWQLVVDIGGGSLDYGVIHLGVLHGDRVGLEAVAALSSGSLPRMTLRTLGGGWLVNFMRLGALTLGARGSLLHRQGGQTDCIDRGDARCFYERSWAIQSAFQSFVQLSRRFALGIEIGHRWVRGRWIDYGRDERRVAGYSDFGGTVLIRLTVW